MAVARALLAAGEADRARAFLDEAASLAPDRADVNGWRARALALTGDVAGAIEALEHVLRFDASAADEARLAAFLRGRARGGAPRAPALQAAW
ncbi:MAG: tetratricopeptide repeat protein, partial [Planctomycetota bacterium]|nr:tetratricopeptide repeat protein [Planctomycetota bacterium]